MNEEPLRTLVERAQNTPYVWARIAYHTPGILASVGVPRDKAQAWVKQSFFEQKIADLHMVESQRYTEFRQLLAPNDKTVEALATYHEERFETLRPYLLKGAKTLDLGAGSGKISKKIDEYGCPCSIADALNWSQVDLPFVQVKDNEIAAPDGAYDQLTAYAVFHHSSDPKKLMTEAFRVAKQRVIFVESTADTLDEYLYTSWMDWFANRITFHYAEDPAKKIAVPCNFESSYGWEKSALRIANLRPTHSVPIGIKQEFAPLRHHILVYDKK
jgi:2-polyprenyl-3-methyl-5-hydroxy-6-metoxy-1,4-benzoquinol methylase